MTIAFATRLGKAAKVQSADLHTALADELWEADRTAKPVSPLTERYPDLVLEDAYAIQTINIARRVAAGQRIIGRKVGLTSRPMQEMLGVNEPDFGVLTDEMFVEDGDLIDLSRLVQPRVEAELAFVMDRDLSGPGVTTGNALAAIAGALPAVEVVDSRVADWKIKLVDTVADNASSGLLVVGGRMRKAGDIVLPGAVHKMVAVDSGDVFRAEFAHLGAVTVRFSTSKEQAA